MELKDEFILVHERKILKAMHMRSPQNVHRKDYIYKNACIDYTFFAAKSTFNSTVHELLKSPVVGTQMHECVLSAVLLGFLHLEHLLLSLAPSKTLLVLSRSDAFSFEERMPALSVVYTKWPGGDGEMR